MVGRPLELSAQPRDLLRTSERLGSLEGELTSLRGLAARHRAEINSAREALQSAKTQRHTHLLLAAVLAMLAGGTAAWFWHRARRSALAAAPSSWYPSDLDERDLLVDDHSLEPSAFAAEPQPEVPAVWDPIATRHRGETLPDAPMLTPVEFILPDAPAPTLQPDQSLGLRVDSLQGAQQQAEFFGSLGQYDEAVAVLTEYLDGVSEKPVLAFLELFRVYHGIGKRLQYEELQSRFRQTFGADVASFSEFSEETRELEAYPVVTMRVCRSWATAEGQDVIEALLFQRPPTRRDVLSLQAYRDLLWLYTLGHDIIHSNRSPAGLQLTGETGLPNRHFNLPWARGDEDGPSELSMESLRTIDVAPDLQAFGVDIDLSAAPSDLVQHSWRDDQTDPQIKRSAPSIPPVLPNVPDSFDDVMEGQGRR